MLRDKRITATKEEEIIRALKETPHATLLRGTLA
jgi:hypothetical protein